ncbi:hypothetical protein CH063_01486 [Colletotrichum higginsianum]|uniref:Uncharacterized protein n=1 Tax=Colletotrichum higginsianum (strain IMI 349063) TaxID=759273 RepID=H1V836_COLHI|nr:uncharacterized protein CH63R_10932 [Colletotrichum higginsianum IMI 349063]OBR06812.1 hypothetical protein CH63R_10932 [Colletotrichum higginsianum IMI 349063]CCF36388.1 hypothetical protein CH063_01486 [Colletotrichum higginsianum]
MPKHSFVHRLAIPEASMGVQVRQQMVHNPIQWMVTCNWERVWRSPRLHGVYSVRVELFPGGCLDQAVWRDHPRNMRHCRHGAFYRTFSGQSLYNSLASRRFALLHSAQIWITHFRLLVLPPESLQVLMMPSLETHTAELDARFSTFREQWLDRK